MPKSFLKRLWELVNVEGSRTLILDSARCIPIKTDRQHYIYVYVRELLTWITVTESGFTNNTMAHFPVELRPIIFLGLKSCWSQWNSPINSTLMSLSHAGGTFVNSAGGSTCQHIVGLHSTYGGPDSLGGADVDRENAVIAKRILFRRRRYNHQEGHRIGMQVVWANSLGFVSPCLIVYKANAESLGGEHHWEALHCVRRSKLQTYNVVTSQTW